MGCIVSIVPLCCMFCVFLSLISKPSLSMPFVHLAGSVRPVPACPPLAYLLFVCLFGLFPQLAHALPTNGQEAAPTARRIPPHTIFAGGEVQTLVLNGAFTGSDLTYSARLQDGSALPEWAVLDAGHGSLTLAPPPEAVGRLLHLDVSATSGELSVSTTLYLLVDYHRYVCQLDANTDRLGRILDCTSQAVRLRGFTSTGTYEWTGPNNFTSREAEPVVTEPGLYQLTTSPTDGSSCPRRSVVEVWNHRNDCDERNNVLPEAHILTDQFTVQEGTPLPLHADGSSDQDGDILTYRWSWEGGFATGPRPNLLLPIGTHEILLTVMDNTGAKSTDRITVEVTEIPLAGEFWLEAECATVGTRWETVEDAAAAGGRYVTSPYESRPTSPGTAPEHIVRFGLTTERGGSYYLSARVNAPSNLQDSYWVRINGGPWYLWGSGFEHGVGFRWARFPHAVDLLTGPNTVDFAYRESGTHLDKLLLSLDDALPTGTGAYLVGCAPNEPPVARATADSYLGTAPHTVTLDASGSTDVNDDIYRYHWAWSGGTAEGIVTRTTLPMGNHDITLTVTDEGGASSTDVLTVQVDPSPPNNDHGPVFWLEAECAEVGTAWSTETSPTAANGTYVVFRQGNSMVEAPADLAANQVRFLVQVPTATPYELFARIDAPTNRDDSYYVRLNDGPWFKWNSGIEQGDGFRWNRLPQALDFRAGDNAIDIAYREDGTRLDKLFLSPVANYNVPHGMGESASNCGIPTDIYLEAECAEASGDWIQHTDADASAHASLALRGVNQMTPPEAGSTHDRLTFAVNLSHSATYHLFMRLDAFHRGHNSVWIRVDDGDWIKFWQEIGGRELLTRGYQWRKVNHDGQDRSFRLSAGKHTITVANREAGTRIDKLFLSPATYAPTGHGPRASNCSGTTSQQMNFLSFATSAEESPSTPDREVAIYPNPVATDLTVSLYDGYRGPVEVRIIDALGRPVLRQAYTKEVGDLVQRIQTTALPAGLYHLWITEGDQRTVRPFVKE